MSMKLTEREQAMLDGAEGWPVQKGMEILCQMGELYGAEKMLPVRNVHMVNASVYLAGNAAVKLAEKMLAEGARFKTDTTLNPASVDLDRWKEYGFTENIYLQQKHLTELFRKMGAIPVHCCSPYLVGQVPRFGEHCCWGESSAVIYANSVIGARTNRNGGPAGLAASLTGVAPAYGYHLTENRYGQILVEVEAKMDEISDYGILGFYVGELVSDGVPVFTGLPSDVSHDALKQLGSALATTGAVALFHVEGVTPEAPTLAAAMGSGKPERIIKVTGHEMRETAEKLKANIKDGFSLVFVGCPHASIQEIEQIARLLEGKKIKDGMEFWVQTGQPIKALAERCGLASIIEDAGAWVICDTCPSHAFLPELREKKRYKAMATNSPKMAHYGWDMGKLPTAVYGVEDCVKIALTGHA
jgi:predicted aconitase